MANYSRYERGIQTKRWFPFLTYGALIILAGVTAYVVFVALTK